MGFLKQLTQQILSIWQKLETRQKVTLAVSVVAFLVIFILFLSWASRPDYSLLYSNLSLEDAGQIVKKLKEDKIPYYIKNGGKAIFVPSSQVYETRLNLAMEGIPKGGQVGFEIFDNTGLIGMTNFMERVNYQRALQGELARTIESLDEIVAARVHLVLPDKSPFIGEQSHPRASVVVKLRPGAMLRKDQIYGIAQLVTGSVESLKTQDVTIVDQSGSILFGGEVNNPSSSFYLTTNQIQLKKEVENYLASKVQSLLLPVVGPDKAVVKVDANLDFDQITRTEEHYDPEGKVVKSEVRREESKQGTGTVVGGTPGVKTNLGKGAILTAGNPGKETTEESELQYAVNKRIEHIIKGVGNIKRISVAVAVDGTYKVGPDGKKKYIPRSARDIENLSSIVKQAVGYDETRGDKVSIINVPFDTSSKEEEQIYWQKVSRWELLKHLPRYIGIGLAAFILFFLLKTMTKIFTSTAQAPSPVAEQRIEKVSPFEDEQWLRQRVFQLAEKDPRKVAQIIKVWITNHGRA